MMIPAWFMGLLVGAVFAVLTYIVLGAVINKTRNDGRIERGQFAFTLDLIRKIDLVTFPVFGALIGHFAFGGSQ